MYRSFPLIAKLIENYSQLTTREIIELYLFTVAALSFLLIFLTKKLFSIRRRRKAIQDLHPFYSAEEIRRATRHYIPTQFQNIAPSREVEPRRTFAVAARDKLLPFFIKDAFKKGNDDQRFYLVLADSGMGKTTFMINLFLKYMTSHTRPYRMQLIPLGNPKAWDTLCSIDEVTARDTILLLDAFDEDPEAASDYIDRLNKIVARVWCFREVVITSRTQFFPSENAEPFEVSLPKSGVDGGFHHFHKLYISPFDDNDVTQYLQNKFSIFAYKKKRAAREVVRKSPNLMARPMLLSYIDTLLDDNKSYESTIEIYDVLISKWIERETARRPGGHIEQSNFRDELKIFSHTIALDMFRNRLQRCGLFIPGDDIAKFATQHNIKLETLDMKSRSLLNRDAEGKYKFAHKSILEYFLAKELFVNRSFKEIFNFEGMDAARLFYRELQFENKLKASFQGSMGHFMTHSSDTLRALKTITVTDFTNLKRLDITTAGNFHGLEELTCIDDLQVLAVSDTSEYPRLYDIYSTFLFEKQFAMLKYRELARQYTVKKEFLDQKVVKVVKRFSGLNPDNGNEIFSDVMLNVARRFLSPEYEGIAAIKFEISKLIKKDDDIAEKQRAAVLKTLKELELSNILKRCNQLERADLVDVLRIAEYIDLSFLKSVPVMSDLSQETLLAEEQELIASDTFISTMSGIQQILKSCICIY